MSPVEDPLLNVLAAQAERQRRGRRFFRRAASIAACAAAIAAGLKFWPVANDVARYTESTSSVSGVAGWSGLAIVLFVVVSGAAAVGGAFAVRTVGWWVEMRMSQSHSRVRGEIARQARASFQRADWDFQPEANDGRDKRGPIADPAPSSQPTPDDEHPMRRRRRVSREP